MRILHYALGFPPYRTGGLTKYCMDLMLQQSNKGHEVAMMWPGAFSLTGHFVRLKKDKKTVENTEIDSFEVINPLPVPLDEGIVLTEEFTKKCPNPKVYKEFLEEYKPDAIHIHTLMGLHKEFVKAAKKLEIPVVFTSHDYFGICPKVTMFRDDKICDGDCSNCFKCNENALSLKKIKILQSGLYRTLKDTAVVKKLRKAHRQEFFDEEKGEQSEAKQSMQNVLSNEIMSENQTNGKIASSYTNQKSGSQTNEEILSNQVNQKFEKMVLDGAENRYDKLRKYYMSILSLVDTIHFNSTVTESVYKKFLPKDTNGKVINISHNNIADNRKAKNFDSKELRITYLAPAKNFKGYGIMKQALDEIWIQNSKDVHLTMYNEALTNAPYITVNDRFEYSELGNIFDNTDVLIMPSVWYETFGFTVLEALSYGVPVIVSKNVGAKDLLDDGKYGMIVEPTVQGVKNAVLELINNREKLLWYNNNIVKDFDMEKVLTSDEKIMELYK